MTAGRPTKYNEDIIKRTKEYLMGAIPENMEIPTVEGLSIHLGIGLRTLYHWGKKHKNFGTLLKEVKTRQKYELMKIGIFGGKEINATIVALMLRVNHKMVEVSKQDITSGGKSVNPMLVRFIDNKDGDTNTD